MLCGCMPTSAFCAPCLELEGPCGRVATGALTSVNRDQLAPSKRTLRCGHHASDHDNEPADGRFLSFVKSSRRSEVSGVGIATCARMAAAATLRPVAVDKYAVAKDLFFNQPDGFPYDSFDPDQVVLPPDDDCGVVSEDDDIAEEDIQNEETGFSTSIGTLPFVRAFGFCWTVCVVLAADSFSSGILAMHFLSHDALAWYS